MESDFYSICKQQLILVAQFPRKWYIIIEEITYV